MRKSDSRLIRQYLRKGSEPRRFRCGEAVDGGVFGGETAWLDVGARRIAPRHLLRRSEVRSALRIGDQFREVVFVCAHGGEEALFTFELSRDPEDGRFYVDSCTRDDARDDDIPTGRHPRFSPESVVTAQLRALQASDLDYAVRYCSPGPIAALSTAEALGQLRGNIARFELGASLLCSESSQLQGVAVWDVSGGRRELVWDMALSEGCWAVSAISEGAVVPV